MNFHRILLLFLSSTNVSIAFMLTAHTNQIHLTNHEVGIQLLPLLSSSSYLLSTPESAAVEGESEATEPAVSRAPTEPGSHEELMYTLGVNLARQLGDIKPLVNTGEELSLVAKGLLDAVIGRLSEEGQISLLQARTADLNNLITERANAIRERIAAQGNSMLKTMSETEGVKTFGSGVCLHILEDGPEGPGAGVQPTAASTIQCHYHGTLPDGTIFDSTLVGADEATKPVNIAVGAVIPGWKEALLKMHEGETAMIGIPSDLAYGDEGSPDGRIPGGAAIFFKVHLLQVLTAGVGGGPTLLAADGSKLKKTEGPGLFGADGNPL